MANIMRVIHPHLPDRSLPIKGSAEAIQVGDLLYLDNRFQASTSQMTVRPASAGSIGSSAADGRKQFADLFAGVANQRHDLNSYDKVGLSVCADGEIEILIANSVGVATAATADIPAGTKVGVAVDSVFRPIADKVQVQGVHSVTVADNEAIGLTTRVTKSGSATVRVHIKAMQVFAQAGI